MLLRHQIADNAYDLVAPTASSGDSPAATFVSSGDDVGLCEEPTADADTALRDDSSTRSLPE
jgi:hypothetical protein